MRKATKTRKKVVSKTELEAKLKEMTERAEWGTRIVAMQQAEVDRLMKLVDTLTNTLNNYSKRDM